MTKEQKPKLYIIAGPTAVGKTKASLLFAKKMNAEIISADSMQVYRGMDIGTAKLREDEMEEIDLEDDEDNENDDGDYDELEDDED